MSISGTFGISVPTLVPERSVEVASERFAISEETMKAIEEIEQNAKMALFHSQDLLLD